MNTSFTFQTFVCSHRSTLFTEFFLLKMQEEIISSEILKYQHPTAIIISGPSQSGKSNICFNLIRYRNEMFDSKVPLKVLYHLPARHKIEVDSDVRNDPDVTFGEGIPQFELINEPTLLILDDLGGEIDDSVVELFVRYSHHNSISVVLVTHNIFHTTKKNYFRTISLNTQVFFLTRNLRDKRQISSLGSQIMPSNTQLLVNMYNDAVDRPYGYLNIDCSQNSDERTRYKTNVFPDEGGVIIYRVPA